MTIPMGMEDQVSPSQPPYHSSRYLWHCHGFGIIVSGVMLFTSHGSLSTTLLTRGLSGSGGSSSVFSASKSTSPTTAWYAAMSSGRGASLGLTGVLTAGAPSVAGATVCDGMRMLLTVGSCTPPVRIPPALELLISVFAFLSATLARYGAAFLTAVFHSLECRSMLSGRPCSNGQSSTVQSPFKNLLHTPSEMSSCRCACVHA